MMQKESDPVWATSILAVQVSVPAPFRAEMLSRACTTKKPCGCSVVDRGISLHENMEPRPLGVGGSFQAHIPCQGAAGMSFDQTHGGGDIVESPCHVVQRLQLSGDGDVMSRHAILPPRTVSQFRARPFHRDVRQSPGSELALGYVGEFPRDDGEDRGRDREHAREDL